MLLSSPLLPPSRQLRPTANVWPADSSPSLPAISTAALLVLVSVSVPTPSLLYNRTIISVDAPNHFVTDEARGATPSGTPSGGDYNCNTGSVQCCNQVSKANDTVISAILGLLGIGGIADDILVGLKCSPLSIVGLGSGNSWCVLIDSSLR